MSRRRLRFPLPLLPAPNGTAPQMPSLDHVHSLVVGQAGSGKSRYLQSVARRVLPQPGHGLTIIDPHGTLARATIQWMACPSNGQVDRIVHIIDPASSYAVGINCLRPYSSTPEGWHDAATTLTFVIESRFDQNAEETPRLARLAYTLGYVCAQNELSVLELLELLTLGGIDLLRTLIERCENPVVRRELEDLLFLAAHSRREFISICESLKNRLVRALGGRPMLRHLAQSQGLDPYAAMENGEVVIFDGSSMNLSDATTIGAMLISMYLADARRRMPDTGKPHRIIVDEAESMLTADAARGLDQTRKFGLFFSFAIQRLGQARRRPEVADALFGNCHQKVCFSVPEPEGARFMAETLNMGHVNLAEWKPGTERATPVGNERIVLTGRARAQHRIESTSSATADVRTHNSSRAAIESEATAWGTVLSAGTGSSVSTLPDSTLPFEIPTPTGLGRSQNTGRATTASGGRNRGAVQGETHGHAVSSQQGHSLAKGLSEGTTEHEAFVTRYESLPTALYTLEEQLHRLAGEIASLPRQHCIVRSGQDAPLRLRVPDVLPAFKSEAYRDLCVSLYLARVAKRSPYMLPIADIDREIAGRVDRLTAEPDIEEPDFSAPEPFRVIDGGRSQTGDNQP